VSQNVKKTQSDPSFLRIEKKKGLKEKGQKEPPADFGHNKPEEASSYRKVYMDLSGRFRNMQIHSTLAALNFVVEFV